MPSAKGAKVHKDIKNGIVASSLPRPCTMTAHNNSLPDTLPDTFETAIAELEQLVRTMEDNSLPLEASLQAYERGLALARFCDDKLQAVAQQVTLLQQAEPTTLSADDITLPPLSDQDPLL